MKIVIDIPEEYLKGEPIQNGSLMCKKILEAVYNGIPFDSFPDREKGEWIPMHPLQANDGGAYVCSKCHSGDYGCERDAFCRWCGADMRGKAE